MPSDRIDPGKVTWSGPPGGDVIDPARVDWGTVPGSEKSFVRRVIDSVTGAGKYEPGIKEFTTGFDLPNPMRTAAGVLFSTEQKQIVDILKEHIPDAEFGKDRFGNLMIKTPQRGEWEYINRPGFSPRDVANSIAQIGMFLLSSRGASKGLEKHGLKSLPMRVGGQAAAGGATSIALDAAASAMGSEEGVDIPKAAVVAGAAGAGELFLPVFNRIYGAIKTNKINVPMIQTALTEAGIPPEAVTSELIEEFTTIARKAASLEEAARVAAARSLPTPVPLTKGQVTLSAKDQMFEDLALKGAYGEGPSAVMRGMAARQEDALRANVHKIQQKIGGGVIERPGDAGIIAQRDLASKAGELNKTIDELYTAAKASGGTVPSDVSERIFDVVSAAAQKRQPHAAMAPKELELLRGILSGGDDVVKQKNAFIYGPNGEPLSFPKETTIRALFDWRRKVAKLASEAPNAVEGGALRDMVKAFDKSLDDAIVNDLASGEAQAIQAWRAAISARKEYGKIFGSGDLIEKLVEVKNGSLKVPPEAASNVIFGASDMNLLARPELARELRKMKTVVSEETWKAIKEEAFLRLVNRGRAGAFYGGEREFSGVNLKKALDTMRTKNPEVWDVLFNSDERALISRFADVAARVTNPVKGGANYSNTSVGLSNLVQRLSEGILTGEKGRMVLGWVVRSLQGSTTAAIRGRPTPITLPAGVVPGLSAGAMYEEAQ